MQFVNNNKMNQFTHKKPHTQWFKNVYAIGMFCSATTIFMSIFRFYFPLVKKRSRMWLIYTTYMCNERTFRFGGGNASDDVARW